MARTDRQHRQADRRQREAPDHAASRQRGGPATTAERQNAGLVLVGVADHVDVDVDARLANHTVDHRAAHQLPESRAARRAEDELRGVQRARRVDERLGHVRADDLAELAAHLLDKPPLAFELLRRADGQSILGADVDGYEVALGPLGHPRGAPDEALALRLSRERDEHALARLPRLLDSVAFAVGPQALLHPIGDPQQRELAQRREVARPEVVRERHVDPLRRVDVAPRQARAHRLGREVDELQLVCPPHDLVGDRLPLPDARDLLDHVVQRLEVLDVQRRDHVDARLEQLLDVLATLLVARAGHVGVGELVDESDLRPTREQRVEVELLERLPPILEAAPRQHLEVADLLGRAPPTVRLDEPDDHVLAPLGATAALVQHRERLADAGSGAEVDAQRATRHELNVTPARRAPG